MLKVGDLFAGIGGIALGFKKAGFNIAWANEFDKKACETYRANFSHKLIDEDIKNVDPSTLEKVDILAGGFPCQAFSIAGHRKGFEDNRGTLFFDIIRFAKLLKPKVIFLENVKGLKNHDKGRTFSVIKNTLEELGYNVFYQVLSAKDFGLPQNRERIYIVAFLDDIDFQFPNKKESNVKLGDILEKKVDEKYTISDKLWKGHQRRKEEHKKKGNGFGYSLFNEDSPYTSTISARYYKDGSEILIDQKDKNPRKLTPREAARLQGFPDDFNIVVSDNQAYKQFGNSVAVLVIEEIAKEIKKSIENPKIIKIKQLEIFSKNHENRKAAYF
jgi:DNA (cytosine-5)-methyltransferase 1